MTQTSTRYERVKLKPLPYERIPKPKAYSTHPRRPLSASEDDPKSVLRDKYSIRKRVPHTIGNPFPEPMGTTFALTAAPGGVPEDMSELSTDDSIMSTNTGTSIPCSPILTQKYVTSPFYDLYVVCAQLVILQEYHLITFFLK